MARRSTYSVMLLALMAAACNGPDGITAITAGITARPNGLASSPKVIHNTGEQPDAPNALPTLPGGATPPAGTTPEGTAAPTSDPAATGQATTTTPTPGPNGTATPGANPTTGPTKAPTPTPVPTATPTPAVMVKRATGSIIPLPFALPKAIELTFPPTLANQVLANNGGNLLANNGGNLISEAGGSILGKMKRTLLSAPEYHLQAGTYNLFNVTMPYLQIYQNSTFMVNFALAGLLSYNVDDVVTVDHMTYTKTVSGPRVLVKAYEGDVVDPAHELMGAAFTSSTQGQLVYRPSQINATTGKLVVHMDFDLATGVLSEAYYLDAAVVHPTGPGVQQQTRLRFTAPPNPAAGAPIFRIDASVFSKDLSTSANSTIAVASSFPAAGGGAYLYSSQGLPGFGFYMDASAQDYLDSAQVPAALKAFLPTSGDFYQPFSLAAPPTASAADAIYQFPN